MKSGIWRYVSSNYIYPPITTATLSVTRGMSTALIGIMVAVALLPPLVALGMLVGAQYWLPGYGAGLLLLVNVTSINLAAVVTFVVQGVRPSTWFEAEEAKKSTRLSGSGS